MRLFDRIYIITQKAVLIFRRTKRRIARVFETCRHLLWLLPVWALFLYFVFIIQQQDNANYIDVVWETRVSIFSSLVITGFTNVYLSESKRHKNLKLQFDLYSRTEYAFLQIVVSTYLNDDYSYWGIFQTQDRLTKSLSSVYEMHKTNGFVKISPNKLFHLLSKAEILLNEISRQYYSGQLDGCPIIGYSYGHEDILHDTMISQQKLRIYLESNDFSAIIKEIPHLANLYYNVLDLIRKPWRLDFETDQKIRHRQNEKW